MQTNTTDRVYAGFFVRLTAFLVDMIIVNAALLAVRIPLWILGWNDPDNFLLQDLIFQYSVKDIVCYLLTVTYFVCMTYYTGATLGKKLFQLRVVSCEERAVTFFEILYRESIGRFLSGVILDLGYLLVLAQKEHRGVHDLLSDTCVVYYHEKKVYVQTQMNYRNVAPQPGYIVPPEAGVPRDAGNTSQMQGEYPSAGAPRDAEVAVQAQSEYQSAETMRDAEAAVQAQGEYPSAGAPRDAEAAAQAQSEYQSAETMRDAEVAAQAQSEYQSAETMRDAEAAAQAQSEYQSVETMQDAEAAAQAQSEYQSVETMRDAEKAAQAERSDEI